MLEFFKSQNSNRMRFEIAGFEIAGSNRQIAGFGNAKEFTYLFAKRKPSFSDT